MGKIELAVLIGAESKEWLEKLSNTVERLEALQENRKKDEAPKIKTGKIAKAQAEDDEEFSLDNEHQAEEPIEEADETLKAEAEEEEESEVTKKDVIAACRANREKAVKVLKKMKVASIHDLKPAQYQRVLDAIGV